MTYTSSGVPDERAGVLRLGIARLRIIRSGGSLADSEDVAPLLECLAIVVIGEGGINGTVPKHHFGACASISRVCSPNKVTPLSGSLGDLAIGTSRVPVTRSGKAGERNTIIS